MRHRSLQVEGIHENGNEPPDGEHEKEPDNAPQHESPALLALLLLGAVHDVSENTPDDNEKCKADDERDDEVENAVEAGQKAGEGGDSRICAYVAASSRLYAGMSVPRVSKYCEGSPVHGWLAKTVPAGTKNENRRTARNEAENNFFMKIFKIDK